MIEAAECTAIAAALSAYDAHYGCRRADRDEL